MSKVPNEIRFRARVVGCVVSGCVDVVFERSAIPTSLPLEIVPIEFRFPNTEFVAVYDRSQGKFVAVEPLS